jgi:hypothetical protein
MRFATASQGTAVNVTLLALGSVFLLGCSKRPAEAGSEEAPGNTADVVA